MSKCKIIPVANQKGGVSKTTSVRNLAFSLAELGYRVLAVDCDPQSNLTASLVVEDENEDENANKDTSKICTTMANLMTMAMDKEELPPKRQQSSNGIAQLHSCWICINRRCYRILS